MIKLDENNQVQEYTLILSTRNHKHIGQILNCVDVNYDRNLNGADEISFEVPKLESEDLKEFSEQERIAISKIWNDITDFKFVYIKELNKYFEIYVTLNEEEYISKMVTGFEACEAELAQSMLYGLEINTEADVKRDGYKSPTKFYLQSDPENSLLNRVLYKLPQYSIKYVDASLCNIQREFSADDTDVYSFLTETVAEEVGCLFVFDSADRSISAYDLRDVCLDCGHRGEFGDVCPKCHSHNVQHFGTDSSILIDSTNLAESIEFHVDTESVKNCFKLQAGDENMTAAVRNRNPNGSDYIYYFSEEQKAEMPADLVQRLEEYDTLMDSYDKEYGTLIENIYEYINQIAYYTHEMMPKRETTPTDAKKEADKLTAANLSPVGLSELTPSTSVATINTALNEYIKTIIKTGWFSGKVKNGRFVYVGEDPEGHKFGSWHGNFEVVNNSDDEDIAESPMVELKIYDDYGTFLEQKIKKNLLIKDEDGSIFDVLAIKDIIAFKEAIKLYGMTRLTSFMDAIQGCIDIMIEADQAKENRELYDTLYIPYLDKLNAVQKEIDKRQQTIDGYKEQLETAQKRQREIQRALDFEKFLGTEMYKVFCCYKREQTYTNDNYISTHLDKDIDNKKLFENAGAFLEAAKLELYKSGNHQHQISSNLLNLLAMKEFEPIRDKFDVGVFIRIKIDNKIYKLRLTQISISFGDIQNIDVEFSDVTKVKHGYTDTQSILEKAQSMSTSYGAMTHQVKSSKEQTDMMKNFVNNGLSATSMKIVNSADKQDIVFNDSGLTARRKQDFNNTYEPYQVKLLNSGLYTTSNAWRTVDNAIGKYYYTDSETGQPKIGFGILAESLVGNLILGQSLVINSEDATASMKFDNFGLVLNAKGGEDGMYKRIFDIQKDGKSQLYMDTKGNIVLATDQFIQMGQQMDNVNAWIGNFENIYVDNATIEKLLAKYAKIETIEAINAEIKNLKVDKAVIDDLKAQNVEISGRLTANEAQIKNLDANMITTDKLEAFKGTITNLLSEYATIKNLEATYAKITDLNVVSGKFDTLSANVANLGKLVADKVDVKDLNVINATIENLKAKVVEIEQLHADVVTTQKLEAELAKINKLITEEITAVNATITNLDAKYATIEQLNAQKANLEELISKKASIEDLNAANATIGQLNALVANIDSLLAGNAGVGTLQAIHLTAQNVNIDDAVIKNLIAANISVNDLKAGKISTNKFEVASDSGNLSMKDNTIQIGDGIRTRVQIGKDATEDYNMYVWDKNGQLMFDALGVTDKGIQRPIIRNDVVANDANISGSKLDINSVVDKINEDGTKVINSNKIWIDEDKQSLGASFTQIKQSVHTNATDLNNYIEETNKILDGMQGQMDGAITTWFDNYVPTPDNLPAKDWNTEAIKNTHLGDLFYDTTTGYCYRWQVQDNVFTWHRLPDTDVTKALEEASKAIDIADKKRTIFVDIPKPPYQIGDLWVQGQSGDILRCKISKTENQLFSDTDWEKASKYTDDSKANEVGNQVNTLRTDFTVEQGKISALIKDTHIENQDGTQSTLKDKYMETVATVNGIKTTIKDVQTDVEGLNTKYTEIKATADGVSSIVGSNKTKWDNASTDAKVAKEEVKNTVKNIIIQFSLSDSDTEYIQFTPWNSLPPKFVEGKFLWQRTKTIYVDETLPATYSDEVCISGKNGKDGIDGKDGKDGEDAILLNIHSSNGMTFKNTCVNTVLTVEIIYGNHIIKNYNDMIEVFGDKAKLIWECKKPNEANSSVILSNDKRLKDHGFIFTLTTDDIFKHMIFNCGLDF